MTGLKMTSMTTADMRAARERGEDLTDYDLLRRNAAAGVSPADDEDAPDASAGMRASLAKKRAGRPLGSGNKEQVSVRFSKEVLTAFRASGAGWQTRMNDALLDWLKTHTPEEIA